MSVLFPDPPVPTCYTVDVASPGLLSKLVAESTLKPDLFLPVPGASALLALPTLTRDRVCCSGMASSITDTLAPPCLPIPARFRGCLCCLPAQVLTCTYRPMGPKMAGLGFAPMGAVLHGHSRAPHARPPPPASAFPFLGMEVHVHRNLSLFLVLEVSLSALTLPQLFPSVSGTFLPQFGVCNLPPKALRKCVFCCLPRLSGRAGPPPPGPCLCRPSEFTSGFHGFHVASCASHHRGD